MKYNTPTPKSLRPKGILAAAALLLSLLAGIFTAMLAPSMAARAGSTARFRQRHSAAFASVTPLAVKDPFTGRTLTTEAGLPFLFVECDDREVYAYCIQKGMQIFDYGNSSRRAWPLDDSMFASALSARAKEHIVLVMLYGYPNRSAAELGAAEDVAHVATQLLLWEAVLACRDMAFRRTDDRVYNAYFSGDAYPPVRILYDAIAQRITEYLRVPSFFEKDQPLRLELEYDPKTGLCSQSFVDTSESNAELEISGKNPAGLAILREGDTYTFQTDKKPAGDTAVSIRRTDIPPCREAYGPPLIWVDSNMGAENQLLFSGCEAREQCYAACLIAPAEPTTEPTTESTTETTTQTETTTESTTMEITETTAQATETTAQTETTTRATTQCTTESTTETTTAKPTTQATTLPGQTTSAATETSTTSQTATSQASIPSTDTTEQTTTSCNTTVQTTTMPGSTAAQPTSRAADTSSTAESTDGGEEVPKTSEISTDAAAATMALSGLTLVALGAGAWIRKRREE